MSEKIFNHISYSSLCPLCHGDLLSYSISIPKKILGIKISEAYLDFFECDSCKKEYSKKIVDTLLHNTSTRIKADDGTLVTQEKTRKNNATSITTKVNYTNTIPLFKNEELFVKIVSKIICVFGKIVNKDQIDLDKVEHIKLKYEEVIVKELKNLAHYNLSETISTLYEEYKIFCNENTVISSWYVLSQSSKFMDVHYFIRNKEQEEIMKTLLKIYGKTELQIQSSLMELYNTNL